MDNDNPNEFVTMINTRGSVVYVRKWEIPLCRQQGMKIIRNPKQSYYPEYDQELNPAQELSDNIVENIDEGDLLEGEEL